MTKVRGISKEQLEELGIPSRGLIFGPNFIPYNPNLKQRSRNLRNNSELAEILLWNEIKAKKLGVRFGRQKPLLHYIVDFYCPTLNLVIEIDGISHHNDDAIEYDRKRQKQLEKIGLTFLRFDDAEVRKDMHNVLEILETRIEELKGEQEL